MAAPSVVWRPDGELMRESNVARFMASEHIDDFASLVARSIDEPEWFWDAVVRFLELPFDRPYEQVLDTSSGIEWATWFGGGQCNAATMCLDRLAADEPAVIWEGENGSTRTLTGAELRTLTDRIASGLAARGVHEGDAVGLFMPMVPETVAALFAIAKLGAIFLPIFSGYGADAVAVRLHDAGAVAVVTAAGFTRRAKIVPMKETADAAVAQAPTVHTVLVVSNGRADAPRHDGRDVWLDDLPDAPFAARPVDSEHPLFVAYTSGTTGRPKGAVHVHAGFTVKVAEEVAFQTDLRPGERLFWLTDIGWIMGPWEIVGTLAAGGTLLMYDGAPDYPEPDRLWSFVERHRVNILGVSPTLIRALMAHGDGPVRAHDLSSLRILASTGEPWNEGPWRWYFDVVGGGRCPVVNISGGTEVGACFLSPHVVQPLSACSLGGPALGMAIDVFDDEGHSVRGEVGELVCTKPWPGMTRGLYRDAQRYIETYWTRFPGVWWHGDFASVSDDGQWFLHGRSDDTIKVAGKRLGPAEVETVVVAHPGVLEAAAIGVPDELKGETLWVFAVPGPGVEPDEELRAELFACVVDALGPSFRPAQIRFTSALPKTRSAKVLRRLIRSVVSGAPPGDLSGLEDPAAVDAITAAVAGIQGAGASAGRAPDRGAAGMTDLIGARVILRPLRPEDWDVWREVRLRCREWLERWEPRPDAGSVDPAVDREAFRSRCGAWDRQRHFDAAYGFGLFLLDGSFAGEVSLGSVQRGPFQMGYVGYWIDEALAGHGYVPEGVVLIMQYAFDVLQLHRLEAAIVPRNAASRRVADKLGLRDEGTAVRFLQIQGVYEDHIRYSMTVEEWRERGHELVAKFVHR